MDAYEVTRQRDLTSSGCAYILMMGFPASLGLEGNINKMKGDGH